MKRLHSFVAFAMALLRQAKKVTVLTVEGATVPGPSGAQMARSLQLNGIPSEALTLKSERRNAGEVILVEDVSGKGHLSKNVEAKLRYSIFVTIDPV